MLKTREIVASLESKPVETLVVKKFGREFEVYPWLKSRWLHKAIMGKDVNQEKNRNVLLNQIKSLPFGFHNFFRRYPSWVFSNDLEKRELNGKMVDKLFDDISEASPFKTLLIELRLFNQFPRKKHAAKYMVSRSVFMLVEELYARMFLRNITIENEALLSTIEKELNLTVNTKDIARKYLAQYRMMKFFLSILPNPKVVYLTVSYSTFGYIRAFKEKNIHVVEMQHGLIGEGHYAYFYTKKFNSNQFPDRLLLMGEKDKEFFEQHTLFPTKKYTVIGSFINDFYASQAIENKENVRSIGVSLQDGQLSRDLLQFALDCDKQSNSQLNWVIKTRREPKEVYEKEFDFPENFIFSSDSVYDVIGKTDVHLTIYSTTAVEALSIGKPVLLLDKKGMATEFLADILGSNPYVQFVYDPEDFQDYLKKFVCTPLRIIAENNASNIKPNYKTNRDAYLSDLKHEVFTK